MTTIPSDLAEIRSDLLAAVAADGRRRPRRLPSRHLILVAIIVAGVAIAATGLANTLLKSAADEQAGLLAGHTLFEGSLPVCRDTSAMSFHCTLDSPPTGMAIYGEDGKRTYDLFLGVKVETVDSNHDVDGGCVAVSADGRSWDCYLGEAAVTHGIISRDMLGKYHPRPAAG